MSDAAVTWVQTLQARGVVLTARGKKLVMTPKSAFGEMSAAERATLKTHRADILDVVRGGHYAPAEPQPTATPRVVEPPVPCPWCHRTPCIGVDHIAYSTLHHDDPVEVARRTKVATAVMLKMMKFGNPY